MKTTILRLVKEQKDNYSKVSHRAVLRLKFLQNLGALFWGIFRAATVAFSKILKLFGSFFDRKIKILFYYGSFKDHLVACKSLFFVILRIAPKLFLFLSHFENSTKCSVLFSVLLPEIPQIWEISQIIGAGDSSG